MGVCTRIVWEGETIKDEAWFVDVPRVGDGIRLTPDGKGWPPMLAVKSVEWPEAGWLPVSLVGGRPTLHVERA